MISTDFPLMRVLVVDDDRFMRDLVKMTLEQLNVGQVQVASSGAEAISRIKQSSRAFDILLCDLQMPGMDGLELLRHLGQLQFKQDIILFSGADERILRAAANLAKEYFLNVLGTVQKPVTSEVLRRLLDKHEPDCAARNRDSHSTMLSAEEFREALLNDHLTLFYQPQIDIPTGNVMGVEALARVQHPLYGLLGPWAFIPLTERGESMVLFTETVIRLALEQASRWRLQGHHFRVSINVSSGALTLMDLPTILSDHSIRLNIEPQSITVEMTETQIDKDVTASLETLTRLRLKGLGLSIDDFGTGFSSLDRLNRVPFDELKIDGGFIHGAMYDKAARAIVESSVALGKQLSLRVLAEGVEDSDDLALATGLGCDAAQGYLIARPMAAEDLDLWLKAWRGLVSIGPT